MNNYDIVEPTPEDHAYHVGWTAYFTMKEQNLERMVNPYDPIDQTKLNEKWSDGFETATISDNI